VPLADAPMFEIGNTLREARLRRGLDILDCEAETKIRAKYLRAMEEEQFDLMPSPTYVRGFLRTYADFLDLDGRLVLDEYESRFGEFREYRPSDGPAHVGAPSPRPRRTDAAAPRRPAGSRRRKAPRRTEVQLLWLAIGGVMSVALLVWLGVGEGSSPTPVSPTAPPAATAGDGVTAPMVVEPDTESTERPQKAKRTAIVLTGTGVNGCWVEVRSRTADGRVVYSGVLTPGMSRTFRISRSMWVRAANPAELDVKIGAKPTVTLGDEGGTWTLTPQGVEDA
jgi:cytoskeleton protein RodZ